MTRQGGSEPSPEPIPEPNPEPSPRFGAEDRHQGSGTPRKIWSEIGRGVSAGAVLPFWLDRPPQEALEVAANAARLGYPEIWIGEMLHFDAFALAGAVARMSERPIITVGPLPIDLRDPVALAMGIGSIAVIGGRPARLAVGASSPAVVERWHGRRWSGQAERLEEGVRLIQFGSRG